MPRSEQANQIIREAQRAKILEAARRVFVKKGWAATMTDVAAEAEVSQGLAYRYFPSKDALFQILAENLTSAINSRNEFFRDMPGTPGERLDFLISKMVNSRREQPEYFQVFYQTLMDEDTPSSLRELVKARSEGFQKVLRQLIVEGQATGEVAQDDPDQLVTAILACLSGLWQAMASGDADEVKNIIPDPKIILRMLKPYPGQK